MTEWAALKARDQANRSASKSSCKRETSLARGRF
jgi:hypothetical protein